MKTLSIEERLIVAADFKPEGGNKRGNASVELSRLLESLRGTGVTVKVNSLLRASGYDVLDEVHRSGLRVFADLKLDDISETLATDGALINEFEPELLTVKCTAGVEGMKKLKDAVPNTEVLGVTILTSLFADHTNAVYNCMPDVAVLRLARLAVDAGIGGVIASPAEASMLRKEFGDKITINTPAVRPTWAMVAGDDQNPKRAKTPAEAIAAGADRIVVGRPITQAKDPLEAVKRTLEEIASAIG